MKTVIEMAHEAGIDAALLAVEGEIVCWEAETKHLERFAELVRADAIVEEREACAKVADDIDPVWESVSAAIRARGEALIRSNT